MDLRSLEVFLAVAEAGSFAAASQRIHRTQPSLTRTVQQLEEEFGVRLFERTSRGVHLTMKGERLARRAREMRQLALETREEMSGGEEIAGTVRIASGETEGMRHLVRRMCAVRREHPAVRFDVASGNAEEVVRQVTLGLADFGVVFDPVDLTPFRSLRLPWSEVWGVLMCTGHPLAERETVDLRSLLPYDLIVSKQLLEGAEWGRWFAQTKGEEAVVPEDLRIASGYNLVTTPRLMAEEGLGVVLTFEHLVRTEGTNLVFRPLDPPQRAAMYFIWKDDRMLSAAAKCFLDAVRSDAGAPRA